MPMLSGTEASSTYAEPDDGILFIRAFAPSSTGGDSSGAVVLRQTASVYSSGMEPWVSIEDETALDVVAEIKFQFSSTVGVDGAEIHVTVKDLVTGDRYNFEPTTNYDRHSWGGGGSALVVDASAGLSGTISKFINVPKSRVKNPFEISYFFYSKTESDRLECYFWNPGLRIINDWYVGNIWSGGDITTVSGNAFQSSGLFIDLSNINTNFSDTDLSNVTYISQIANMSPTKVYSYMFSPEINSAANTNDFFRGAILKRYTSNLVQQGRYNLLATLNASALHESRLDAQVYAVSPELHRSSILTEFDGQDTLVKPSDLCLQVSSSLSGSFSCSADRAFKLKGEVLKEFNNGLSAAPVGFILETSGLDSNGKRLRFNFGTGTWAVSGENTVLSSTSIFNTGRFSPFESVPIDPAPLTSQGVSQNSDGAFDFILTVSSLSNRSAFVKSLRVDSLAIPSTQQQKELFDFSKGDPKNHWVALSDNTNIFSGTTANNVAPRTKANMGTGSLDESDFTKFRVNSMCLSPNNVHSDETTYQFMILRDTTSNGTAAGEFSRIMGAYCTDAALTFVEDEVEGDILTSETYFRSHRREIIGKPYVMMNNFSSLYGTEFYIPTNWNNLDAAPGFLLWPGKSEAIVLRNASQAVGGVEREPNTSLCQSFRYNDLSLPVSSEGVAFSFEYVAPYQEEANPVKWSANANTSSGKIVHWDATTSTWSEVRRGEEPRNDFVYTVSGAGLPPAPSVFTRTPVVDISNQYFDEDTVITFSIVFNNFENGATSLRWLLLNDWRFYNVTASAMFDLGAFPAPEETTVQPPSLPAGRLGQFTNNIEINASSTPAPRALGSANWAPDPTTSALASDSVGDIGSTHNAGGCVNSDGFVYSGIENSEGFCFSGYVPSSTATSIVHVIDLSATDVNFFDLQGGIGAMGLWAVDIDKTYAKLLDNGYSLDSIYDKAGGAGELYNVTDIDRNPVFKLLAKKVFRQPITIASGLTNPSLRIVWEINFL